MEKKIKKIAFYINAIHEGGAERVMINLCRQFADAGTDTTLITSFRDTWEYDVPTNVKRLSLEEKDSGQRIQKNIRRIVRLRKLCKEEKYDCLVSFMAEPNYRAVLSTIGLPTKTIISVRNDPTKEYPGKVGRILATKLLPKADGCVFQTQDAQEWFPKELVQKSCIIFNAVKDEFYDVVNQPVPGKIVTVGRLEEQKNHKLLIEAFEQIYKKYPYIKLDIYGSGSLKNDLQKMIDDKSLTNVITLKGPTKDVKGVLKSTHIFVLSSDFEGMPNALMEAMAAGVPCVSTDCPCGGPRMLLGDNEYGLLVPTNDKEALIKSIEYMLIDVDKTCQYRIAAKNRSKEFTSDKVFQQWISYLEKIHASK